MRRGGIHNNSGRPLILSCHIVRQYHYNSESDCMFDDVASPYFGARDCFPPVSNIETSLGDESADLFQVRAKWEWVLTT